MDDLLAMIAVAAAVALLAYLGWCYIRERQIRKHIRELVKGSGGKNVTTQPPPERARMNATTRGSCDKDALRSRRRGRHPWKRRDTQTR